MRVAWIACVVAGCGFQPAVFTVDAPPADAPPDGSGASMCQQSGWIDMGGRYYRLTSALVEWGTAAAQCASAGGHLEKITTSTENEVARTESVAASNLVWIGLKNLHLDGVYYWDDNTQLATGDYHLFATGGIPADTSKPCVAIATNGEWYLSSCFSPSLYQGLCQCP
jgi:hypothetical protein